ncbi:MAG TPA: DUF5715 family protein, partial [Draconibacterium sp.]|nr:DUF5715 family protein [Draconibacterium sp.]
MQTATKQIKSKKRRLKKKYKIRFIVFIVVALSALILYFPARKKVESMLHPAPIGTVKVDWYRDLNLIHLKHAKTHGIKPFKTNQQLKDEVPELMKEGKLVQISDNSYYRICPLTHSHPYLTPSAKDFLNELGKRFSAKLEEHELPHYYYQISSLLRTDENQKSLSGSNGNASPNTSHRYATTFDIPYFTVVKRTLLWKEAEVTDGRA